MVGLSDSWILSEEILKHVGVGYLKTESIEVSVFHLIGMWHSMNTSFDEQKTEYFFSQKMTFENGPGGDGVWVWSACWLCDYSVHVITILVMVITVWMFGMLQEWIPESRVVDMVWCLVLINPQNHCKYHSCPVSTSHACLDWIRHTAPFPWYSLFRDVITLLFSLPLVIDTPIPLVLTTPSAAFDSHLSWFFLKILIRHNSTDVNVVGRLCLLITWLHECTD